MSVPGMLPFDAAVAAIVDRAGVAQFAFEAFARARVDIVVNQSVGVRATITLVRRRRGCQMAPVVENQVGIVKRS